MYKRLLSLLVFIPMFLLALYVRNQHKPLTAPESERGAAIHEADRDFPSGFGREERRHERLGASEDQENGSGEDRLSPGREQHGSSDQPGVFDFYLLNLSWSPEFCATHPGKPECAAHPGFVLHGLWPQNNDGSYPEHCSDSPGPSDPAAFRDLYPDADLLRHEWSTHGTCSGLSPEVFFGAARSAVRALTIPESLARLDQPASKTPGNLLLDFSRANPNIPHGGFALSCGNNYLTAVEVCLDRQLHPVSCRGVRSCRANIVRIVPPGGERQ